MSTQHPDNVAVPFFAPSATMGGDDEVREAFYAYSHLGCDEQMWDAEGKEVDAFVVEKLLAAYPDFFREHALGEEIFLTPRVPNPAVERSQAKILLEVLHSLPRHSDIARLFYERERPPIVEVILPMTTAAKDLQRIGRYYETFVAGMAGVRVLEDDGPMRETFGAFAPASIAVIPLLEDRDRLQSADAIVRDFLRMRPSSALRVFIARSDPALNYGMTSAVLLALGALERLQTVERDTGVAIYPILGAGGAPFRGNLRPPTVANVLATYGSVQTFTIQSAFKYDYPSGEAAAAITALRTAPRTAAIPLMDDGRAEAIIEKTTRAYQAAVQHLAPLVRVIARQVPRRRMRKQHIGLFGYSRSSGAAALPRAIPFCAALYSIGLPPEVLGSSALDSEERRWLSERVPGFDEDMQDALRYLDPDALHDLPEAVRADVAAVADLITETDVEHVAVSRLIRRSLDAAPEAMADLIVRAGALRRFLG